ncbi:hypothetical protein DQW50_15655 [Halorubrum sp. 48-1-W]|uniref:DUF6276 family protein n=1 Tax=Halorubrum sp. 48-1-W TaxID=2249761 RepID=UPI000DCC4311|nr:DUF6276 family protein [Halorubrum sp. 48-1-W]RAW44186.1 hypothetical protein DQW50_15655 [Halorubrum sp. 48-1-W]
MACPHCSSSVVAFAVPSDLREHAPADGAAICTRCLRVVPAVDAGIEAVPADPPDLSAVDPAFPGGDAGIALALLCGHLESFALSRASIEALVAHAEREGADVFAFLDRLDAPDAAFDLDRRRTALLDLL